YPSSFPITSVRSGNISTDVLQTNQSPYWFVPLETTFKGLVPAILDMLNCEQPDWLAWSRLARIAPIESQLKGAKLVVRHGNGEVLMRVVEWIQKVEVRDDALEAEILGRLNRGQLDIMSRLELLTALNSISPEKVQEYSASLCQLEEHPMAKIAERGRALRRT
ncbi:MAG: hypothetical protein KDB14_28625, partial [Planctomycetales bacterium]|nr:hypothetical protein [Planctomycetales bacterium]